MNNPSLSERINGFDYTYMYADCYATSQAWSREEQDIRKAIAALSETELIELYTSIDEASRTELFGKIITKTLGYAPKVVKAKEMKPAIDKRRPFKDAWAYVRKGLVSSMREALKLAWKPIKAIIKLRKQHVVMNYIKVDGKRKLAFGTLQDCEIKNTNPELIVYFDTGKDAIRSFRNWELPIILCSGQKDK